MKIYIVKKDDTLYKLANKYGITLEELIAMNSQLANPDELDVGMKIKVPSTLIPSSNHEIVHKHVAKEGDTLWKLSKAWGIQLQTLIDANPQLKNPNVLAIGQVVNIPKVQADANTPVPNFPLPSKAELTQPKKEMTKPKAEMTKPKAEMTKPKAEMTKPKEEVAKPVEGIKKPEIVQPKKEFSPQVPTNQPPMNLPYVPPAPVCPPAYEIPVPVFPQYAFPVSYEPCGCNQMNSNWNPMYQQPNTEPNIQPQNKYPSYGPPCPIVPLFCEPGFPAMPSVIYPPVPPICGGVTPGVLGCIPSNVPTTMPMGAWRPMVEPCPYPCCCHENWGGMQNTNESYSNVLNLHAHAAQECDSHMQSTMYVPNDANYYNPVLHGTIPEIPNASFAESSLKSTVDCSCKNKRFEQENGNENETTENKEGHISSVKEEEEESTVPRAAQRSNKQAQKKTKPKPSKIKMKSMPWINA